MQASPSPLGLILAGGRSERMGGREKAMLSLGGRPMIAHVVERLERQVERIVINANGDPVRFQGFGLPVIADTVQGFAGPLAGLLAGLSYSLGAAGGAPVVTVAADTPFFPLDLVGRLADEQAGDGSRMVIAQSESGRHPTIGLWPASLLGDLTRYLASGSRKAGDWVERHRPAAVSFETIVAGGCRIDPFFNINRPEDLARAETYAEALA
ncbi:MAG: molybdenum cofactor guanylyltransferase MobA [Hyphomicrobiaceae bacterium]